jgi:hypothetical protein
MDMRGTVTASAEMAKPLGIRVLAPSLRPKGVAWLLKPKTNWNGDLMKKTPIPLMVALACASVSVTSYALATQRAPTNAQRLHRTFNDRPSQFLTNLRARMRP